MTEQHSNEAARLKFDRLIWPHRAMVLRHALLLCNHFADAEDLAQQTLLKAFRAIDSLRENEGVKAWLTTILRNTWTDQWRKNARADADVSLDNLPFEPAAPKRAAEPDTTGPHLPDDILQSLSDLDLLRSLRRLPAEMRWTVLLVDVAGHDYQQAAEILQVPIGTVRSRLNRARAILKQDLLNGAAAKHTAAPRE